MCDVLIITTFWKGVGGGVAAYSYGLYTALKELGCNVRVLYVKGSPSEDTLKISPVFPKLLWQVFKNSLSISDNGNKITLVYGGWPYLLAALIGKKRSKVFYIFHSHTDKKYEGLGKKILEFLLSKTDGALFVSRGLKRNLEEVGGLRIFGKWHVLYGSASVEIPSKKGIASFRERFGIEEKRFYLLALGLTSLQAKTRGAKLLIDALRHLPPHVELILTGKGRFYSMLKEYATVQGVDDRVIFPGYLKNPHVATMVADIYTHISYGEGLPLALLEVMSLGKAIIASRVMGIPESLRSPKEGILIENNVDNVVSNVTVLIENPKLKKKMAVLSRRAFLSRFSSWKMTALKLLSF